MVETEALTDLISTEEFLIRLEGAAVVGEILSVKGRFRRPWGQLGEDPNHEGAHPTAAGFADFLTYVTERRTAFPTTGPGAEERREVNKVLATPNQGVEVLKRTAQNYRALGDEEEYFKFPDWASMGWETAYQAWGLHHEPGDSVDGQKF